MDAIHQELLQLENAGWQSLCDGTASDFYGQIMTSDARMILAGGTTMTTAEVVRALVHAPPWDGYTIEDSATIQISGDTVALVYTGTGHRNDGPDFTGIMASTYIREESQWQLVLYQQTPKS